MSEEKITRFPRGSHEKPSQKTVEEIKTDADVLFSEATAIAAYMRQFPTRVASVLITEIIDGEGDDAMSQYIIRGFGTVSPGHVLSIIVGANDHGTDD